MRSFEWLKLSILLHFELHLVFNLAIIYFKHANSLAIDLRYVKLRDKIYINRIETSLKLKTYNTKKAINLSIQLFSFVRNINLIFIVSFKIFYENPIVLFEIKENCGRKVMGAAGRKTQTK